MTIMVVRMRDTMTMAVVILATIMAAVGTMEAMTTMVAVTTTEEGIIN
jgi:hypothetical protein